MRDGVAAAFARALVEVAHKQGSLNEVRDSAVAFAEALRRDPQLLGFMLNPAIDRHRKREIIATNLKGVLNDLFVRFLCFVVEKGVQLKLPQALRLVPPFADEVEGRIVVEVQSARPLSEEETRGLQEALSQRFCGGSVVLKTKITESVIGGVLLRWRDRLLDGTVKGRLQRLGAFLKEEVIREGFLGST